MEQSSWPESRCGPVLHVAAPSGDTPPACNPSAEKERKLEIERVCALPAADFYAYLNQIRPEDNEVGGTVATAGLWWELERMKRTPFASPWKKRMALKKLKEKLERQR